MHGPAICADGFERPRRTARRWPAALAAALAAAALAVVAAVAAAAPASAAGRPVISAITTCAYAGTQFMLVGENFEPGQPVSLEVMGSADPRAGEPASAREATADASGRLRLLLDAPPAASTSPVVRSVRARTRPDPSLGAPALLATTTLTAARRGVAVHPAGAHGRAGARVRWRLTGLPEGIRMWAHYRRGGRTVERVRLGSAADPCGRLRFALPTLPAKRVRPGTWDLWITSRRAFSPSRGRIHVQRRMRVSGRGADARVTFGALRMRLLPADERIVAPVTNFFAADATKLGLINMIFGGAGGARVTFYERVGDRLKRLGSARAAPGAETVLPEAATWSCSRLTRRFIAMARLPDGSRASGAARIRTSSCASRFRISAPRRVVRGRRLVARVVDRWGNGAITPTLCVTPPRARRSCARLRFAPAVTIARRSYRARTSGTWRLELRVRGRRVRRTVRVGATAAAEKPLPVLLATGDSTVVGIDTFLADELAGEASVHGDARPGTGISKPPAPWPRTAAEQASGLRPVGTVISIGGSDGFPMTTPAGEVECCSEAWSDEYARRVRAMMVTYLRGGRGRVFWLTLPLPRAAYRTAAARAVNRAIVRAGTGLAGVTVVRLDALFTPSGYRETMRYRGRDVRVRDVDGVHLSVEGQAIAAKVLAPIVRRRGLASRR